MLDGINKRGLSVELLDLRKEKVIIEKGIVTNRIAMPGDPKGYVYFNLAKHSALYDLAHKERIRGADYDAKETIARGYYKSLTQPLAVSVSLRNGIIKNKKNEHFCMESPFFNDSFYLYPLILKLLCIFLNAPKRCGKSACAK